LLNVGAVLLLQTGCGDQVECPRGMTGDPCRFTDDIGPTPTSPPLTAVTDASTGTADGDVTPVPETDAPQQDDGDQPDGDGDAGPEVGSSDGRSVDERAETRFALRSRASHPPLTWQHQGFGNLLETPNAHIAAGLSLQGPARPHLAPGRRGTVRDTTGKIDATAGLMAGFCAAFPSEA